jgi:outer membrane protein assembly factor BamB
MKLFLRTRTGFGLAHLSGAAIVEGPSEESGAARMSVARVAIMCALILFSLTVSSTKADTVLLKDLVYVDSYSESQMGGLIFAYETKSAYDTSPLNPRWRTYLESFDILSVSADKRNVYVVGTDTQTGAGALAVLSATTGEPLWSTTFVGSAVTFDSAVHPAPAVMKDYIYVATQNVVWALDKMDGTPLWAHHVDFMGSVNASPAADKRFIYVSTVDTSTGMVDTLWTLDIDTAAKLSSTQLIN